MRRKQKPHARHKACNQDIAAREQLAEAELLRQIKRLLALPMNKRTHFLRVRLPCGGSHL